MNKSGLLIRLAVVIGFAAVAIGFLSTQLFYRLTYNQEVKIAHQNIESLYRTIETTAATAAYLADADLAKEVVTGLTTNDVVLNATMSFEDITVSGNESLSVEPRVFAVQSLFEQEKTIGSLAIEPNLEFIESRARQLALDNAKAMIIQAFVVTLVAICVAFLLITRPMIKIAQSLHKTTPGEGNRLAVPEFHQHSELGGLVRDINNLLDKTEQQFSQERQLRSEIEALEKRFRMLFENSFSPIVLMEPRGNILLFNAAFEKIIERLELPLRKSFGPLLEGLFAEPSKLSKTVELAFANEEIATGEFKLKSQDPELSLWVQVVVTSIISDDLREYYQITLHDISKRKKELEALAYQADFDKLTNLYNRQGLEKKLDQFIDNKKPFALVLIDLNWFKQINDVYGHESGDEILIFVADRMKKTLRPQDFGCRWGGDEFVLLLDNASHHETRDLVDRLARRIGRPYFLRKFNQNVTIGASIGAAMYPQDSSDLQTIINLADNAMYDVKKTKDDHPGLSLKFANELVGEASVREKSV
ncbi:diguanylate cyclase [Alteromonas pelagimontana]|uniref:Diguanylate cyclase n=1 Tax=Alteromonas pelagimontana TaxID=1858656 RepID=A0A6M4MG09_9ALTE|nr:sensor domain-containing diguanylate cyclase [Alteromonas pelagimontana]QJR82023.1 diguanylate cyclase [Alteromonas pelagimontana]